MSSREPVRPGPPAPPADELRAHAFADGYGEGLRDALRELLQAARSSTPQELRWQIESRLARIPQDVELKRRALLGPPPSHAGWDAPRHLALAAPPPPAPAPAAAPTLSGTLTGSGVLFKERTPVGASAHVSSVWRNFGRVIAFGRAPDPPLAVPPA
ncbi:MAG: hypothetical protein L3J81_04785, partial [Thermoplasmata archaeon]|nr:hypothetical protein [Thermoplasmata archaeon]